MSVCYRTDNKLVSLRLVVFLLPLLLLTGCSSGVSSGPTTTTAQGVIINPLSFTYCCDPSESFPQALGLITFTKQTLGDLTWSLMSSSHALSSPMGTLVTEVTDSVTLEVRANRCGDGSLSIQTITTNVPGSASTETTITDTCSNTQP